MENTKQPSSAWISQEFEALNFNDKRLNKRFHELCIRFNKKPKSIVRQVIDDVHQCKAAYRFWANKKVTSENILNSHKASLSKRVAKHPIVLEIQDSTELDYRSHLKKTGKGHTARGVDEGGYQMHTSIVITPDKEPLGIASLRLWGRPAKRTIKGKDVRKLPIKEKESYKWFRALEDGDGIYNTNCKRVIIADREADFYDFLQYLTDRNETFIIRLKWNRKITGEESTIRDRMSEQESWGSFEVNIDSKGGPFARQARSLNLEIRVVSDNLAFKDRANKKASIPLNVVQAKEPVEGGEEWLLLTNLQLKNFNDARQLVDWYSASWEIEEYYKLLKGAYKIEDIRLCTKERTQNLITLLSIICYRLFWISRVSRGVPSLPAELVFGKRELRITAKMLKQKSFDSDFSVSEMVISIAMLGGYWNRKKDPPPGCIVILRGWMKLQEAIYMNELLSE